MERREFGIWAAALQTYYPRYNLLPNREAMELWYRELSDMSAELLTAALRKWVNTEKFPPSIAELRTIAGEITAGKLPDWGSGWQEVAKAISRYGYMNKDKALASMTEITKRTVQQLGWEDICLSEEPEIMRAQFRQVFEANVRREAENRQIPASLKENMNQIGGKNEQLLPGRQL